MKAIRRALIALIVSLGLTAGFSPLARADTPPDPTWVWGSSFNCQQGVSTVSECAYYVVARLVGFTGPDGCVVEQQAPEYCDKIASDEHTWLWRPVTTWDIAQAMLLGYAQVTEDPNLPHGGFTETFAQSLYTAAQARVASLFDPVTHVYIGAPTLKDFSKSYAPSISGRAVVGQTLTAKVKTWKPSEAKGWQWQSNGVDIAGATSYKYKVTAAELGTTITVKLTGSKVGYNSVTKTSKPTKTVTPGKITRGKVKVKGSRHVGATLSAYTSKWTSGVTFACQWYKNKVLQVGATTCKYVLGTSDYKARLSVAVSATKAGYYNAKAKVSSRTGKIAKGYLTKGTVTITGTPQVNETLTVNPGTWGQDGVAFKYQWYYGSRKISGATAASYTLTAKQLGKYVRVKVTGSLPFYYSAYKYSAWTAKVAPVPAPPTPEPTPTPPPSTP